MIELPKWVQEKLLASPNATKENELIVYQVDDKICAARWKDQLSQFELDIQWEIEKTNRAK
jgi:hypothetical protein